MDDASVEDSGWIASWAFAARCCPSPTPVTPLSVLPGDRGGPGFTTVEVLLPKRCGVTVFVNGDDLTEVRQSRWTTDPCAPLEGRVGVRATF